MIGLFPSAGDILAGINLIQDQRFQNQGKTSNVSETNFEEDFTVSGLNRALKKFKTFKKSYNCVNLICLTDVGRQLLEYISKEPFTMKF